MSESDGTFRSFSKGFVKDYTDLLAYRKSFHLSKEIFETTKNFPKEEMYSLTDQFRRAIRSIGANIAEAWGKRRYEKHFISKLTDADAERLETRHKCTVSHIMVTSLRSKWAAGKARGGRISESIRNRRATQPPAHFHRNPPGRGRLAVFPRCSLLTYQFRYARHSRLEKQPTGRRRCRHYMRDSTPAQNLVCLRIHQQW